MAEKAAENAPEQIEAPAEAPAAAPALEKPAEAPAPAEPVEKPAEKPAEEGAQPPAAAEEKPISKKKKKAAPKQPTEPVKYSPNRPVRSVVAAAAKKKEEEKKAAAAPKKVEEEKKAAPKKKPAAAPAPAAAKGNKKRPAPAAKKGSDAEDDGPQRKKARRVSARPGMDHPSYLAMIVEATQDAENKSASYYSLERAIRDKYALKDVTDATLRRWIRITVNRALETGELSVVNGRAGTFRATAAGKQYLRKALANKPEAPAAKKAAPAKKTAPAKKKAAAAPAAKKAAPAKEAPKKEAAKDAKKAEDVPEGTRRSKRLRNVPAEGEEAEEPSPVSSPEPAPKKKRAAAAPKEKKPRAAAPKKRAKKAGKADEAEEGKAEKKDKEVPSAPEVAAEITTAGIAFNTTDIPVVRDDVTAIIKNLLQDDSNTVGVIANRGAGEASPYILEKLDFTNDVSKISSFVEGSFGEGSNWLEYYKMVLESAAHLPWASCRARYLILVGDNGTEVLRDPSLQVAVGRLETLGVHVYGFHHSQLEVLSAVLSSL